MPKFRNKFNQSVVIEAVQYVPGGQLLIESWMFGCGARDQFGVAYDNVQIRTLEGVVEAAPGDWIIRGIKGEFYPCKPDIFEIIFSPAPDSGENTPRLCDCERGYSGFGLAARVCDCPRLAPDSGENTKEQNDDKA